METPLGRMHDVHELAWSATGEGSIDIDGIDYPVNGQWALWIPAKMRHVVRAEPTTYVMPLWFAPDQFESWSATPRVVVRTADLDRHVSVALQPELFGAEAARDAKVLVHQQLGVMMMDGAAPPLPTAGPARQVALALVRSPGRAERLEDWARDVHVSPKTLQRAFVAEVGMPFRRWRTRVRLAASLPLLRSGESVATASAQVGFRSTSAFSQACRAEFGRTPGELRDSGLEPFAASA